jgi:galactose mutarotase-like enzyme
VNGPATRGIGKTDSGQSQDVSFPSPRIVRSSILHDFTTCVSDFPQVYTSNFLSEDEADAPATQHNAVCLETEYFPNAVNHPGFNQDVIVRPGRPYEHYTYHQFYVARGTE